MTVLGMKFLPDPILRRRTRKVGKVPPRMKQLTDDMVETMHAQLGVGLAANQVGSLQRVAVIQLPDWEEALVLINPEIIRREGEREIEEGCLSIPGYRGVVKRSVSVRARAIGLDGKEIRIRADGLLAQALEHETGHLNGSLYIDHLVSPESFYKIGAPPEVEEQEETPPNGPDDSQPAAEGGPTQ